MREKLYRFMIGRRGMDHYSKFLMTITMIVLVASLFVKGSKLYMALYLIGLLLLVYTYFRVFSKNIYKREMENNRYLALTYRMRNYFAAQKQRNANKKYYSYFKCPSCGSEMKAPKGKGKIQVTCHKCNNVFIKKV